MKKKRKEEWVDLTQETYIKYNNNYNYIPRHGLSNMDIL